jgi:TonB family protein
MPKLFWMLALFLFLSAPGGTERHVKHVDSLDYPRLALLARIEGDVQLTVQIDPEGKIQFVAAGSGNPLLVQAAEENVRGWRFDPDEAEKLTITYKFRLEEPEQPAPSSRCSFDFPDVVTVESHFSAVVGAP